MNKIKIISFDVEGTLVSHEFSEVLWHEAIPLRYAQKYGISAEQARKTTTEEFEKIGFQGMEWYDAGYWCNHFQLGNPEPIIRSCVDKISYYPEVSEVLSSLAAHFILTVASTVPLYLLAYILKDVDHYFTRIYSATSQYKQLKTPYFYSQVCQTMHVEPDRIVHVGDNWNTDFINPREVGINAFYLDREGGDSVDSLADLTQLKSIVLDGANSKKE